MPRSIADAFSAVTEPPTREVREPWDLWAEGVCDDFEATLLEADAADRHAAGDRLGGRRLRVQAQDLRRRAGELRVLADRWRELRREQPLSSDDA